MRKLFTLMVLPLLIFMAACGGSEDDPQPNNVISDSQGVTISLEWSTGGTVEEAKNEADLDLKVVRDGNTVASSSSFSSFEETSLTSANSDASYDVQVKYYGGSADVTFTVIVTGIASGASVEYTATFDSEDGGTGLYDDFITITKEGNDYTIVR